MTGIHTRIGRTGPACLRIASAGCAISLAVLIAGGCEGARISDSAHPRLTDTTRRHPIAVVAETATLDVAVELYGKGQEARAMVETTRFARKYREEARGPMFIAVPGQGRAASDRLAMVRQVLYREGVPQRALRIARQSGANLTLSYDRIAAVGPTCGDWSEDVTRNRQNLAYPNFGCATQRNIAHMTANPTDLMFPAAAVERKGDRRDIPYKHLVTTPPQPTTLTQK